jgi:hypothetical protein
MPRQGPALSRVKDIFSIDVAHGLQQVARDLQLLLPVRLSQPKSSEILRRPNTPTDGKRACGAREWGPTFDRLSLTWCTVTVTLPPPSNNPYAKVRRETHTTNGVRRITTPISGDGSGILAQHRCRRTHSMDATHIDLRWRAVTQT